MIKVGIHWITLYYNDNSAKHILKEIKKLIGNKNIIRNIYRIQAYNLISCAYSCVGFTDFMLKSKFMLDYTISFSSNDYEKIEW